MIHTAIPLTWRYTNLTVSKCQQLNLSLTAFIDIWTLIFRSVRNAVAISDCIFCSDVTNLLNRIDAGLEYRTKVVTYFRERG